MASIYTQNDKIQTYTYVLCCVVKAMYKKNEKKTCLNGLSRAFSRIYFVSFLSRYFQWRYPGCWEEGIDLVWV